jgi:hypothetical protein
MEVSQYISNPKSLTIHAVVLSISRERVKRKYGDFYDCTQENLGYGSTPKLEWSIYWAIEFWHTLMVSNIPLVKFPIKMFQNESNVLQRDFSPPN